MNDMYPKQEIFHGESLETLLGQWSAAVRKEVCNTTKDNLLKGREDDSTIGMLISSNFPEVPVFEWDEISVGEVTVVTTPTAVNGYLTFPTISAIRLKIPYSGDHSYLSMSTGYSHNYQPEYRWKIVHQGLFAIDIAHPDINGLNSEYVAEWYLSLKKVISETLDHVNKLVEETKNTVVVASGTILEDRRMAFSVLDDLRRELSKKDFNLT